MQSSLQRHSDQERIPLPHVSLDPSTQPSLQMLGTGTAHQILLSSSVSSGCKGSQVPVASSDKCGDQQVHPEAPRKQRKERTVYSEEQKVLLQRHFDQGNYPSQKKLMELALMIGVTEYEIKVCIALVLIPCSQKSYGSCALIKNPTHSVILHYLGQHGTVV